MNLVKEYIDWSGRWIPDKPDKIEKSRKYFYKQELSKKLSELIEKYQDKVNRNEIVDIINDLQRKYNK